MYLQPVNTPHLQICLVQQLQALLPVPLLEGQTLA